MKTHEGKPMDEESLKEWEQAFIDIEESIEGLEECETTNR